MYGILGSGGILKVLSEGRGYYIEDRGSKRASGFRPVNPTGEAFWPLKGVGWQKVGEIQLSFLTESEVESDFMIVILSRFSNNMHTFLAKKEAHKALCRAK